jgi:hypothetical protein
MSEQQVLIPPPPVVRERLASNVREGRLLRSLLRLSLRAAEERRQAEQRGSGRAPASYGGGPQAVAS